jgi:hypothetical protein
VRAVLKILLAAGVIGLAGALVATAWAATIMGTARNDLLRGTAKADRVYGKAGNDTLYGHTGNDLLSGGTGYDKLYGGPGDDTLIGGPGKDTYLCGPGKDGVIADANDVKPGSDCEVIKGLPPTINPSLTVTTGHGGQNCNPACFFVNVKGTGFHPRSAISLTFTYTTPCCNHTLSEPNQLVAFSNGTWEALRAMGAEDCIFDGKQYSGPIDGTWTATDKQGATASAQESGGASVCP